MGTYTVDIVFLGPFHSVRLRVEVVVIQAAAVTRKPAVGAQVDVALELRAVAPAPFAIQAELVPRQSPVFIK